jgi:hypothetical protein
MSYGALCGGGALDKEPVDLSKDVLDNRLSALRNFRDKLATEARWRRILAYLLKAIYVFGGVFVAAKIGSQSVIGIIIAVAGALDVVLSNLGRLVSVVTAQYASQHLVSEIEYERESNLVRFAKIQKTDSEEAGIRLVELLDNLGSRAQGGLQQLSKAVADKDVQLLANLLPQGTTTK